MATNALTKLTKNQFILFMDVAKDLTLAACSWKAIDLSTIFSFAAGEQTQDNDYICYESAVTEVTSNKPEISQEIAIYEGNPIYDFMAEEFYNLPIGDEAKVPILMCFGGTDARAWEAVSTLTSKVLDTVAGKITFTVSLGGDIKKGTYAITSGVPTFTEEG